MAELTSFLPWVGSGCCCFAVFLIALVGFSYAFRPRRPRGSDVKGIAPAPGRGIQTAASMTRMESSFAAPPAAPKRSGAPQPSAAATAAAKPLPASAAAKPIPAAAPPNATAIPAAAPPNPTPIPAAAPVIPPGARLLTPSVTIAPGSGETPPPPKKV